MADYYTGKRLATAIAMVKFGLRDLRNPDLFPFYDGPTIPTDLISSGFSAIKSEREAIGLSPMTAEAYTTQAGSPSSYFFTEYLDFAGLSVEYVNDLFESAGDQLVPSLGERTSFIKEQSSKISLSVSTIRDRIRSRSLPVRAVTQHLVQTDPPAIADSDPYVRAKLTKMREYITRYLVA